MQQVGKQTGRAPYDAAGHEEMSKGGREIGCMVQPRRRCVCAGEKHQKGR